ncbi:MAG: hypothetical protein WD009_11930 [Phycisphaeraceae bacterium]
MPHDAAPTQSCRAPAPAHAPAGDTPASRPRRRWLRRAVAALAVLAVILALAGFILTRPGPLSYIVTQALTRTTGADVELEIARLNWGGRLTVDTLELRVPGLVGDAGRLFEARQAAVEFSLGALLGGRLPVRRVALDEPRLYLTEDRDAYHYTYQRLLPGPDDNDPALPNALPELTVRDGALRFGELDAELNYHALASLPLHGVLVQDGQTPSAYHFSLRQEPDDPPADDALELIGTVDLAEPRIDARLEHFRFVEGQRYLLPRDLRRWWQRLDPEGELPTISLTYRPDRPQATEAELIMRNVSLSVPIAEIDPRMTDVHARLGLAGETLYVEQLTGRVEGIGYEVQGRIEGLRLDAPLDLYVRTEPFELTDEPPALANTTDQLARAYNRFQPRGRFEARAHVHRAAAGEQLTYEGRLLVAHAAGRYDKFPYPLQDVHGTIHFNNDELHIEGLTGRTPAGGEVHITGRVTPPHGRARIDMTITGEQLTVDRHLFRALRPRQRQALALFFDAAGHRRLVDAGHIRTGPDPDRPGSRARGRASAPRFDLAAGRADMMLEARRLGPEQTHGRVAIEALLRPTEPVHGLFAHWPYPLTATGGQLAIERTRIRAEDIVVEGLTGASGRIAGLVHIDPEARRVTPDLYIDNARLPIDELLLASLPHAQQRWVRSLHASGTLLGHGRIFRDPDRPRGADFSLTFSPGNVELRPFGGRLRLAELAGEFTLAPGRVTLDGLTARHAGGSLTADGRFTWGEQAPPRHRLRLQAIDFPLSAELLDLLPPGHEARAPLAQLFDTYQPAGRFDATVNLAARGDATSAETWKASLRPRRLAFNFGGERIALADLAGEAHVAPGELRLSGLRGWVGANVVQLDGRVALTDADVGTVDLRLGGTLHRIDAPLRAVLPPPVLALLERLAVQGPIHLANTRLRYAPDADAGQELIRFTGRLELDGTSLDIGTALTEIEGHIELDIAYHRGAADPVVALTLRARQLLAAGRPIAPLTLRLATDPDRPDRLHITHLTGTMHGGTLAGRGWIETGQGRRTRLELTLQDVAALPVIDPESEIDGNDAGAGRLTASLTLETVPNEPMARRGRLSLRIRDAQLYERPLTLALLQAASLTVPTANAFRDAEVEAIIAGNDILIEHLHLGAATVALSGAGTLHYPTQRLDLSFYARNPATPRLGVLSDMIDVLVDQLMGIRVTGTLEDPDAYVVSMEDLRRSWQGVLGQGGARGGPEPAQAVP